MALGSIRHHIRLSYPAATVWQLLGAPERLHEWFPGITGCTVDDSKRVITLGSGLQMPEEILVHDQVQRRFQYRIDVPIFAFHRGTIDVIPLSDTECLAVYTTEADPRAMALVVAGAAQAGLQALPALIPHLVPGSVAGPDTAPDSTSSQEAH